MKNNSIENKIKMQLVNGNKNKCKSRLPKMQSHHSMHQVRAGEGVLKHAHLLILSYLKWFNKD